MRNGRTETETIKNRYSRIAGLYDFFEAPMEHSFAAWRRELLAEAQGRVLEVGVGTGKNLPYYSPETRVIAIDFSPGMIERAHGRIEKKEIENVELREMDVQRLDFPDHFFDTIVSTCVFCSVPLPVEGLKELHRVLKPEGRMLMLEHVRSKKLLTGPLMDLINPLPLYIYGANINRRTIDNLRAAGFSRIDEENLWSDIMKRIVARP